MWLLFLYFMQNYFTLVILMDFMITEKSLHYADDSAAYQAR